MFGLFDKADVEIIVPDAVLMEEAFECVVKVNPKSDANLRKIEMEFFCQEKAITRGTTDYTSYKKIFSDERIPQNEIKIQKGRALEYKEVFQLPALSPPTMRANNHFVEWFLRVRLDVPFWPDTRKEAMVVVLPALLTSAPEEEMYYGEKL